MNFVKMIYDENGNPTGEFIHSDEDMENKPIEEFKTQEELNECLKWWQNKLFLNNWIITAYMVEPHQFNNEEVDGENHFVITCMASNIKILKKEYFGERIEKYCAERILVHEMLHCKYNWLSNETSYEGKYVDVMEHALLEQMAKTLIMAKYDLGLDYFKG